MTGWSWALRWDRYGALCQGLVNGVCGRSQSEPGISSRHIQCTCMVTFTFSSLIVCWVDSICWYLTRIQVNVPNIMKIIMYKHIFEWYIFHSNVTFFAEDSFGHSDMLYWGRVALLCLGQRHTEIFTWLSEKEYIDIYMYFTFDIITCIKQIK